MWFAIEAHAQDRTMLRNDDNEEKRRTRPLGGGRWHHGCAKGTISLPRAGGRRRNNCRELAEICRLDTASSTGKNITETLQICNAHPSVLGPVSCLQVLTHCFLGWGLPLLRANFPHPWLPWVLFVLGERKVLFSALGRKLPSLHAVLHRSMCLGLGHRPTSASVHCEELSAPRLAGDSPGPSREGWGDARG